MMLYPTVQELTNEKTNRYSLVIAAAKCARHIIDKSNAEHEFEEQRKDDSAHYAKEVKDEDLLLSEKPVSIAIKRIYEGEYKIIG